MKITFPNKEQAKEAFENAMRNATVYYWDKKPKKHITVTANYAEDVEQAKAIEKIYNKIFLKLMKMQGFAEEFNNCISKKTLFQFNKYLDKI